MTGIHGAAQMVSSETDFSFIDKSLGGEKIVIFDMSSSYFNLGTIVFFSALSHIPLHFGINTWHHKKVQKIMGIIEN